MTLPLVATALRQPPSHPPGLRHRLGEPPLGWREREPRLFAFGLLMLALMLPALLALGLDDRMLRGLPVWIKPLKFMASVALFAFTTAWFLGHLPAAVRRGRAVSILVWTLIATGGFEVAYITLQAALGQASHYHVGDAFHGFMYSLMGAAALVLTATQPALAWLIGRHGLSGLAPAYRLAVVLGLVLTFVLGATAGLALGGRQSPDGAGLAVLGWHLGGGDLRPAHFIGIHAQQLLPLLGAVLVLAGARRARLGVVLGAVALTALWALAFTRGLAA
jgi:hypothetical protein